MGRGTVDGSDLRRCEHTGLWQTSVSTRHQIAGVDRFGIHISACSDLRYLHHCGASAIVREYSRIGSGEPVCRRCETPAERRERMAG